MSKGFVPEGDKLHMMQPQRPGAFIAVTEAGVIMEIVAMMETKQVMVREWEQVTWDDAAVEAESLRVQTEMNRMQAMQQHGGQVANPNRGPQSSILKPGQVVRPGTV